MNIDVKPLTSDSNHKKVTPKVTKFKGFSYKRVMVLRAVNAEKSFKIDIAMSYPMLFPDGLKQHVIVGCYFEKSSFKTADIQAMLASVMQASKKKNIQCHGSNPFIL